MCHKVALKELPVRLTLRQRLSTKDARFFRNKPRKTCQFFGVNYLERMKGGFSTSLRTPCPSSLSVTRRPNYGPRSAVNTIQSKGKSFLTSLCFGANEGSRTLDRSLGSFYFAVKLHSQVIFQLIISQFFGVCKYFFISLCCITTFFVIKLYYNIFYGDLLWLYSLKF